MVWREVCFPTSISSASTCASPPSKAFALRFSNMSDVARDIWFRVQGLGFRV